MLRQYRFYVVTILSDMFSCIWAPKKRWKLFAESWSKNVHLSTPLMHRCTYVHNGICISHIYLLSVSNLCVMPSEQAENTEQKRRRQWQRRWRRRRSTKKNRTKKQHEKDWWIWAIECLLFTVVACCCCFFCYSFYCRILSKRIFLTQIHTTSKDDTHTLSHTSEHWDTMTRIDGNKSHNSDDAFDDLIYPNERSSCAWQCLKWSGKYITANDKKTIEFLKA